MTSNRSPSKPPPSGRALTGLANQRRSELFYRVLITLGRIVYRITSRSVELNTRATQGGGGLLVACNHVGPYDIPCLLKSSRRPLDFVSQTRFAEMWFVGWLFRNLNVVFLSREGGFGDSGVFKELAKRLRRGHAVAMFPEAEMRRPGTEASQTGHFYSGFGKLAVLGRAPILPAAVLDTNNFKAFSGWLPFPKTTWGVIFGEPIPIPSDVDAATAAERIEQQWLEQVTKLEAELRSALDARFGHRAS